MKEPANPVHKTGLKIGELLRKPLEDRSFRKIVILLAFWNFSFQIGSPFTSVYMVSGLGLNFTYITIVTALASIASVLSVRKWGRLADKTSWGFLMVILLAIQGVSHFVWFLTGDSTVYFLVPAAQILGGAAISGMNITIFNLQYTVAPVANRTVYIGFSSAVGGLFGFLGTLAGSFFLGVFEKEGNTPIVPGIAGIRFVFLLSSITLFLCFLIFKYLLNEAGKRKQ